MNRCAPQYIQFPSVGIVNRRKKTIAVCFTFSCKICNLQKNLISSLITNFDLRSKFRRIQFSSKELVHLNFIVKQTEI